jgi:hypothetical protein
VKTCAGSVDVFELKLIVGADVGGVAEDLGSSPLLGPASKGGSIGSLKGSSFNFGLTFSVLDFMLYTELGFAFSLKVSVIDVCLLSLERRLLGDMVTWDRGHHQVLQQH